MLLRFWYIMSQVKFSAKIRTELHLAIEDAFFTRVSKDPVLNKNEVHIRNINVQIYTNKFLWLIQISLQTFQVSAILLQATAEAWKLNTNNTNYKYKERGYKYK